MCNAHHKSDLQTAEASRLDLRWVPSTDVSSLETPTLSMWYDPDAGRPSGRVHAIHSEGKTVVGFSERSGTVDSDSWIQ
jgi:hypothetical protein